MAQTGFPFFVRGLRSTKREPLRPASQILEAESPGLPYGKFAFGHDFCKKKQKYAPSANFGYAWTLGETFFKYS